MHALYVVLISACKKHPQKFTLHTQTCSLNQKMQHISIRSIKVNYKKKVTCSPVAFTACLSTWQKPFFDFRKKIMFFLINHFTHRTTIGSEQLAVNMEVTTTIKLLLQQSNRACQNDVFLEDPDLNYPVKSIWDLEEAFLIRTMLTKLCFYLKGTVTACSEVYTLY